MKLLVRPANVEDAAALTDIINPIIAAGGTTAHLTPFNETRMRDHYVAPGGLISCMIAEVDGVPVGFQALVWPNEVEDRFPEGWAIIASFVMIERTGAGIGRALFNATRDAAKGAGVQVIDATIRADNDAGLRYYSNLGFRDYELMRGVPLRDGTPVDRVRKRFDLA